jgi:hypothetical protein
MDKTSGTVCLHSSIRTKVQMFTTFFSAVQNQVTLTVVVAAAMEVVAAMGLLRGWCCSNLSDDSSTKCH